MEKVEFFVIGGQTCIRRNGVSKPLTSSDRDAVEFMLERMQEYFPAAMERLQEWAEESKPNKRFFEFRIVDRFIRCNFGEADFLPGLTVDKYENVLVAEALTLGMEKLKADILKMLKASGNLIENIDSVNEYAKSGKKDSATRDSAYECCLAVASVDKMEQIGDMSNDELIELYRNTVFSVPDYQTNNDIKRKRWREIRYFNDVYDVSDMYRLDETLGAVEIKEIGGVIYDV